MEGGVAGCCKLHGVGVLGFCSCPHRPGHHAPINLQQDKYYSLFYNYLSRYEWKSVIPLKVRALRMGFLCVSGHRQHAFTKGAEPA